MILPWRCGIIRRAPSWMPIRVPEGVDVHDRVPVLLGHVHQVHRLVEAGVVEQHVEAAGLLDERVEGGDRPGRAC